MKLLHFVWLTPVLVLNGVMKQFQHLIRQFILMFLKKFNYIYFIRLNILPFEKIYLVIQYYTRLLVCFKGYIILGKSRVGAYGASSTKTGNTP